MREVILDKLAKFTQGRSVKELLLLKECKSNPDGLSQILSQLQKEGLIKLATRGNVSVYMINPDTLKKEVKKAPEPSPKKADTKPSETGKKKLPPAAGPVLKKAFEDAHDLPIGKVKQPRTPVKMTKHQALAEAKPLDAGILEEAEKAQGKRSSGAEKSLKGAIDEVSGKKSASPAGKKDGKASKSAEADQSLETTKKRVLSYLEKLRQHDKDHSTEYGLKKTLKGADDLGPALDALQNEGKIEIKLTAKTLYVSLPDNSPAAGLQRLKDLGVYPAGLEELKSSCDADKESDAKFKALIKRSKPPILSTPDKLSPMYVFAEDVDKILDFPDILARAKESGKPDLYPMSLAALIDAVKAPAPASRALKSRLNQAKKRPLDGVVSCEHKRTVFLALPEDQQLLDFTTLSSKELLSQARGLWLENQKLRTTIEIADKRSLSEQNLPTMPAVGQHDDNIVEVIRRMCKKSKFKNVKIPALRSEIPHIAKENLDAALIRLSELDHIDLEPLNDPASLTAGERPHLLRLGSNEYYSVSMRGDRKHE